MKLFGDIGAGIVTALMLCVFVISLVNGHAALADCIALIGALMLLIIWGTARCKRKYGKDW